MWPPRLAARRAFTALPITQERYTDKTHSLRQRYADVALAMEGASRCKFVFVKDGAGVANFPGELSEKLLAQLSFTADASPLFAQAAPLAGGPLDDLPVLEPHDEHHLAVIATRREGSEIHAWQRLYFIP